MIINLNKASSRSLGVAQSLVGKLINELVSLCWDNKNNGTKKFKTIKYKWEIFKGCNS